MFDLTHELRKCTECSCSRCNMQGTEHCYIEVAIRELNRYDQAVIVFEKEKKNAD